MIEVIEEKIDELNWIATNFKKSVNKVYKPETLVAKRSKIQTLYIHIQKLILTDTSISNLQHDCLKQLAEDAYQSALAIINKKLDSGSLYKFKFKTAVNTIIAKNRLNKMALDIATASKIAELIPVYDGSPEGAKSFTDAITFLNSVVTDQQKPGTIRLALTKLTGKARELFTDVPADLNTIVTKITDNCVDRTSADLVLSNLQNIKWQRNETQKYTADIEKMCEKLTRAYISEQIPTDVARKLALKAAIKAMINQSSSTETKMMLRIGKFETLKEACNIMIENDNITSTTAQVLQTGSQQNRRYENTPRNFRRNFSRGGHSNRNNSYDRFRSFRNYNDRPPARDYNQNNYRGNNNFRNRGFGRGRFQSQNTNRYSRVYYASINPQAGNLTPQQQGNAPGPQAHQAASQLIYPNQASPTFAHVVQTQQPHQMQQHFLDQRI